MVNQPLWFVGRCPQRRQRLKGRNNVRQSISKVVLRIGKHIQKLGIFTECKAFYWLDAVLIDCVCVLITQSYLTLCNAMDYSLPVSSVHGIFLIRVLHFLLQGIFLTQGLNLSSISGSLALADRFFTTVPPGKPLILLLHDNWFSMRILCLEQCGCLLGESSWKRGIGGG